VKVDTGSAPRARAETDRWMRGFLAGTGLCAVALVANGVWSEIDASNLWGMTYGSVAAVLMLGAGLLGGRRRTMRAGFGTARSWQRFHLYGGTLFLILVLMHAAFQYPRGLLSQGLFVLSVWVAASGWIGVWLQKWIPGVLTSGLSIEAVYERIPELVRVTAERAEAVARQSSETVRDFHERVLAPRMRAPTLRMGYFLDAGGVRQEHAPEFRYLLTVVPDSEAPRVRELEQLYRTKLELDVHFSLQRALRYWLWIHVPPSLVLVGLVAMHIYVVFRY
jgi:hypothetical protein